MNSACALLAYLYLTLTNLKNQGFMASPQTFFIVTNLPNDLDSWLNLTTIPGSSPLALLVYCGAGHLLIEALPCHLCYCAVLPAPDEAACPYCSLTNF